MVTAGVSRVLIANRGEIARRVAATCRALGIGCVAVHSDADADAPHVRDADAAVRLPGVSAAETYLRADLLVEAALHSGADAVHPGYGFLSENADFAAAVLAAGLVWIGPPPAAIAAMGSKTAAKKAMDAAGVPVLAELDPDTVTDADLPVLVKASAGGGGRGMRVVRTRAELPGALAAAQAEAAAAFGDGTVFVEPYVERGRHVEVQVLADTHGTVWALGERECSIQRRHQKVLEEAPSPAVEATPGLRERLQEAAVTAARTIGYVGAGTVEFLVEGDRFFFLETNTRLQVEHPVTECRYGLDLVRRQLAIAGGAALPPEPPAARGHAIEVRLYAEDPASGWAPQTGTVHRFEVPGVAARFAVPPREDVPVLRVDSGVEDGSVVSPHYDPMLAKLIVWAPTRHEAAARLAAALTRTRLHGVRTNRDLLVRTLRDEAFLTGDTDTHYVERRGLEVLAAPLVGEGGARDAATAAALARAEAARRARPVLRGLPSGWRNVAGAPQRTAFTVNGSGADDVVEVEYAPAPNGVVSVAPDRVVLDKDGVRRAYAVAAYPGLVCVDGPDGAVDLVPVDRFPPARSAQVAGSLLAPMPGTVLRLGPVVGERVTAGQPVLWLEAMKMEHAVRSPADGVVAALPVRVGQQVEVGAVLAVVSAPDGTADQTADQTAEQSREQVAEQEESG